MRVLLVEDDEISQMSEKTMLQKLGYRVHTANHGGVASASLRGDVFDCVLMDVQMNVMDGVEATRGSGRTVHCCLMRRFRSSP